MQDLKEIWYVVRQTIKTDDALFALIRNKAFLPKIGKLEQPIESVDVKFRGEAAKEVKQSQGKECLRDPKMPSKFYLQWEGSEERELCNPCTVDEIRKRAIREGWFKDKSIKTGFIEVAKRVGDDWVKLNDCQLIRGGEVMVRELMPALDRRRKVTCIVPMQE
jgi:hypothetical protein